MARRAREPRRTRPAAKRQYPRTARLNTLLQEIVADHLKLVEDDRLGLLTVTGVEVDADLNRAQVFVSALADESLDKEILDALDEHRKAIQASIASSARLRKTPEVAFSFDPGVRAGARIEAILATLRTGEGPGHGEGVGGDEGDGATTDSGTTDSDAADSGEVAEP